MKLMRGLIIRARSATSLSILLMLALLVCLLPAGSLEPALADPGKLKWSIVDTPAPGLADKNIIVSPSEINVIVTPSDPDLGEEDARTFYAVDIANSQVYKSTDGGNTWADDPTASLVRYGANLPAWNIAAAPDDPDFVVAVTDGTGAPNGPKEVFVYNPDDPNPKWQDTSFPDPPTFPNNEYISCIDISIAYSDSQRDIAVGTRDGAGGGTVWVLNKTAAGWKWKDQTDAATGDPTGSWTGGDVVAVDFSPNYGIDDYYLAAVSATAATGTQLDLGERDTGANTTVWKTDEGYPVTVIDTNHLGTSPNAAQIITADLELPPDFSRTQSNYRRYYVSTDAVAAGTQSGVYRVDDAVVHLIEDPNAGRISSIAYSDTEDYGTRLLAGEVTPSATSPGTVPIWRTSNLADQVPTWEKSDPDYKSPTGGANPLILPGGPCYANAQLAWSAAGDRAYCGTSSADLRLGGTSMAIAGTWPLALTTSVALDESAFSVSPYSRSYETLLDTAGKAKDSDIGNIWNQLSLIDTRIDRLTDVAALEVPEDSKYYNVLYLASIYSLPLPGWNSFDSVWRSTSDPLGETWERVLCTATANDIILRVNPRKSGDARSNVVTFADRLTNDARYSDDEGQEWRLLTAGVGAAVTDLTLASDDVVYILDDTLVCRGEKSGTTWAWPSRFRIDTGLASGHTIATPLQNPKSEYVDQDADWVIVGEQGRGRVAYADFSKLDPKHTPSRPKFEPPPGERVAVPQVGNIHVIADDRFEENKTIYAASDNPAGKIYRWAIDQSIDWDDLEPPNSEFYGLAQLSDVLYGAWDTAVAAATQPGVDRTLEPRKAVPPPPWWDDLTTGLTAGVAFTREPSALKISTNTYNNLWAIDDHSYDWANGIGCLWAYTDTAAKLGPWTTSPPSDDLIPVDPVTGRAKEIDFRWRQLSYVEAYELQLAKDDDFNIRILVSDNITPVDPLAPACYFPAGGLVPTPASEIAAWGNLECGHTYYWRVRARRATTGEIIRSPWSATMYFTVKTGLPVRSEHLGPVLLKPTHGARDVSLSPAFSWSPIPGTEQYEFILAEDPALTRVVATVTVLATAYEYDGELDRNTAYFWRVTALAPVASEPSPVFTFTVKAKSAPDTPYASLPPVSPFWVWIAIAIYVALVAAIIVWVRIRAA